MPLRCMPSCRGPIHSAVVLLIKLIDAAEFDEPFGAVIVIAVVSTLRALLTSRHGVVSIR